MLSGTWQVLGAWTRSTSMEHKRCGAKGSLRLALLAQGDTLNLFNEFPGQSARRVHESYSARIGVEDELCVIVVGDGAVDRVVGFDGGNQKHSQAEKHQQKRYPKNDPCLHHQ